MEAAGPIRDLLANVPWVLIIGAFIGGLYVSARFPIVANIFKPKASNDVLLDRLNEIEKRLPK